MNPVSNHVQFGSAAAAAAASAAIAARRRSDKDPHATSLSRELYRCIKKSWNDENSRLYEAKKLFIQA